MAIFALYGRGIPRVPSESLPAERALWRYTTAGCWRCWCHILGKSARWKGYFGLSKFLHDFPFFQNVSTTILIVTTIKNNSTRNLKIFLRNLVEFFIYIFFENFTLLFVITNTKKPFTIQKILILTFKKFYFYFVI